jgi:hypothetical protein
LKNACAVFTSFQSEMRKGSQRFQKNSEVSELVFGVHAWLPLRGRKTV